jgi:hypothetical protein
VESATLPVPHSDLNRVAVSATAHCLVGCAAGELVGMMIATALGWGDVASIALAVGLAYLFGFSLTARPLVRAGLGAGAVISTALAADTVSITIMEVIDNAFVVIVPGAMGAGLDDPLIYASIAGGSRASASMASTGSRGSRARQRPR